MSMILNRLNILKSTLLASRSNLLRSNPSFLSTVTSSPSTQVPESEHISEPAEELDTLYKYLELQLKAHETPVLYSYRKFVIATSEELGIPFVKSEEPWRHIFRKPLLKSRFIYKDHRAVYEFRTYFLNLHFKNLTGSTADTFLEYIQRNLPEGVHMTVVKTALAKFPDHLNPQQAISSE